MSVTVTGLSEIISAINYELDGNLKMNLVSWAEDVGLEFLDVVQSEIRRAKNIDTSRLLSSFTKGSADNIFVISNGGLTIEVGTHVPYAQWVNSGHWTTSGEAQRWIPGVWSGGSFTYSPGADTGMLLKRKWVEGSHYWDNAVNLFQGIFESSLQKKLDVWAEELEARMG